MCIHTLMSRMHTHLCVHGVCVCVEVESHEEKKNSILLLRKSMKNKPQSCTKGRLF